MSKHVDDMSKRAEVEIDQGMDEVYEGVDKMRRATVSNIELFSTEIDGVTEQLGKAADDLSTQVDEGVNEMRRATVVNIETTGKAFSEMLGIIQATAETTSMEQEGKLCQEQQESEGETGEGETGRVAAVQKARAHGGLRNEGRKKYEAGAAVGGMSPSTEGGQHEKRQAVTEETTAVAAGGGKGNDEDEDEFAEASTGALGSGDEERGGEEEEAEADVASPFSHLTDYREAWMEKGRGV
jgi:hypothetical protein